MSDNPDRLIDVEVWEHSPMTIDLTSETSEQSFDSRVGPRSSIRNQHSRVADSLRQDGTAYSRHTQGRGGRNRQTASRRPPLTLEINSDNSENDPTYHPGMEEGQIEDDLFLANPMDERINSFQYEDLLLDNNRGDGDDDAFEPLEANTAQSTVIDLTNSPVGDHAVAHTRSPPPRAPRPNLDRRGTYYNRILRNPRNTSRRHGHSGTPSSDLGSLFLRMQSRINVADSSSNLRDFIGSHQLPGMLTWGTHSYAEFPSMVPFVSTPASLDYIESTFFPSASPATSTGLDSQNDGRSISREPSPELPVREGFTRSLGLEQVLICPGCLKELAYDPNDAPTAPTTSTTAKNKKKTNDNQFWALKSCGHVYCRSCFVNRRPVGKNAPVSVFRKIPEKSQSKRYCVVDGCDTDIGLATSWVGLYL